MGTKRRQLYPVSNRWTGSMTGAQPDTVYIGGGGVEIVFVTLSIFDFAVS